MIHLRSTALRDDRRAHRFAVALLALGCAAGCGYLRSGTWEDDPGNWWRAFESTKPPAVVVVHSRYTRFPHFTHEFEYWFAIGPNAELERQVIGENQLVRVERPWSRSAPAPAWFAPKAAREYERWELPGSPETDFQVLVDQSTREIFVSDRRL